MEHSRDVSEEGIELSDLDTTRADAGTLSAARRDRIVISAPKPRERSCARVPVDYALGVRRAGGAPLVVSTFEICDGEPEPDDLDVVSDLAPDETSVLEWASGLVLTGGGDVDPAFYGQSPHPRTYNVSRRRDTFEFNLLDAALERDMPVLAICRGMQVLNVHLGGTLEQHLLDTAGRLEHDRDRPRAEAAHEVRLATDSVLARMGERVAVNSHHHQCVDALAQPLEAIGAADDGVLEAVVSRAHGWVVGVQWHPEAMVPVYREQLALFEAFVEAASRYSELRAEARPASPGRP